MNGSELTTYFEDQHLIVLEKPAGLLSQGDISEEENLVDLLRVRFGRHYVGLVHRLDRNTSGIMVVAKRSKAAERLTAALQSGEIVRKYQALLIGKVSGGTWRHELSKDDENMVRVLRRPEPGSKSAVLHCSPLRSGNFEGLPLTLVEFQLETGRSHQIRVQAEAEGHPVLGDSKYSKGLSDDARRRSMKFGYQALHSVSLTFPHPMSKEVLTFSSPLPRNLEYCLG
jgi:23S rRNA pseudouridine1911/1915/1917 synthase